MDHGDERFDPHAVTLLPGTAATSPGHERRAGALADERTHPSCLGRYTLLDVLGRGGMGTVYEALDDRIGRNVALKLLHAELGGRHAERLVREAQALARLSHPNVVQVFDVGQHAGRWFIAMERVPGRTLRAWQDSKPGWRAGLAAYIQAGSGLAAAHRAGLTHRDFKPGNCIIDDEGRVRVLDFGLARDISDASAEQSSCEPLHTPREQPLGSLTRTGEVLGTLGYMPLEQLEGRAADARSDQWSFCASLYEALYGERPFAAEAAGSLTLELMRGEVRPAPKRSHVPRRLRRALVRGLSKDPDARWPSMDALLAELGTIWGARRTWGTAAAVGVAVVGLGLAGELLGPSHAAEPPLRAVVPEPHALAVEDGQPPSPAALALRELAEASYASNQGTVLQAELERIAPGQALPEDPSLAAEVLLWQARIAADPETSATLLRQAHLLARQADVPSVESRAAGAMAGNMQGAHAEGVAEWMRLAWVAIERTPWDRHAAIEVAVTAAHSAASTWQFTHDKAGAMALLEFADAVVGAVEPDDDELVAMQLVLLAGGWSAVDEPERALYWGLQARALVGAIASPAHAQWAKASEEIGRAIHARTTGGRCQEAIVYLDDARDGYLAQGNGRSAANVGFEVADCLRELGQLEAALAEIRRVGEHWATDDTIYIGQRQRAHLIAANLLLELKRTEKAVADYEQVLALVDLNASDQKYRNEAKRALEQLRADGRLRTRER